VYGRPLNGAMLCSLARAYVSALNSSGTPTISTAWERVVASQCEVRRDMHGIQNKHHCPEKKQRRKKKKKHAADSCWVGVAPVSPLRDNVLCVPLCVPLPSELLTKGSRHMKLTSRLRRRPELEQALGLGLHVPTQQSNPAQPRVL